MHDQEKKNKLYILCGLSNEDADVRSALTNAAGEKGYEAVCVNRYRKEGILQYVSEHPEFTVLVLQEAMQGNYPYTAEELAELADDYHLNIIVLISKSHKANQYMKILYTAGILNALYEEDATAENILKFIFYPRTRRQCRGYYQIATAADAMQTLEIIDEERTNRYLSYLEEAQSNEEIIKRYKYIAKDLKIVENIYLARNLPGSIKRVLSEDEMYLQFISLQKKKRRRPFWNRKTATVKEQQITEVDPTKIAQQAVDLVEKEKELPTIPKEYDAGEMIDEDISDLLGFNVVAKDIIAKEFYAVEAESEETGEKDNKKIPVRKKINSKHGKIDVVSVITCIGALCFLAVVILFAFFLYSEHQREKTPPVINEQTKHASDENVEKTNEETDTKKTETEPIEESQEESKDSELQSDEPGNMNDNSEDSPETTVEDTVSEAREENNQQPVVEQQNEVTAVAEAVNSVPSVEVSVAEGTSIPTITPQAKNEKNYDGKIFTGSEVASIAQTEESKGNRIYLKTRGTEEGFFSAAEIAGLVDSSCSYLAQGVTNGQLSFIQQ